MDKDFEKWNIQKQDLERINKNLLFYEREVWWCILGINIGVEIDGKHELFLRPVLILRKFNNDMTLIIPISSVNKVGKYYMSASSEDGKTYNLRLSQLRSISSKRLVRKTGTISFNCYQNILEKTAHMILGIHP